MSSENKGADWSAHRILFDAFIKQGDARYNAKRYKEAIVSYEKAIQCKPGKAEAYVGKGNSLRQLGEYQQALWCYEKALDFEPKSTSAYNGRYYLYVILGEDDKASTPYKNPNAMSQQRAIGTDKTRMSQEILLNPRQMARNITDYLEEGKEYFNQHQYTEALQMFNEVLVRRPQYAYAHTWKGITLVELGRFEEAIQSMKIASQI